MNSSVFADTFYFLALVNARDADHENCVSFSESINRPLVTTTWVLMEVGDALRSGRKQEIFLLLLDNLRQDPDAVVLDATQEWFNQGLALFRERPDKDWSLTDCTSFVAMAEHGIEDALTADHHFEQAGFKALLAS